MCETSSLIPSKIARYIRNRCMLANTTLNTRLLCTNMTSMSPDLVQHARCPLVAHGLGTCKVFETMQHPWIRNNATTGWNSRIVPVKSVL